MQIDNEIDDNDSNNEHGIAVELNNQLYFAYYEAAENINFATIHPNLTQFNAGICSAYNDTAATALENAFKLLPTR